MSDQHFEKQFEIHICCGKELAKRLAKKSGSTPSFGSSYELQTIWTESSYKSCVGCDIVKADHAPDGGVAQGVLHGILVRHHGRNQEEVEEELGQEVKGQEEEDTQTTTCTCMDGMR